VRAAWTSNRAASALYKNAAIVEESLLLKCLVDAAEGGFLTHHGIVSIKRLIWLHLADMVKE